MKVFLSWSGELSQAVASELRDWLPSVIQDIDPWMSEEDIEKGTRWLPELGRELEAQSVGIVCVSRSNLASPWLHFEAGALAKLLEKSRVCPLLIDLRKSDLRPPLSQFQATRLEDPSDVLKLMRTINRTREKPLTDKVLDKAFRLHWSDLVTPIAKHIDSAKKTRHAPRRDQGKILEEVLDIVRAMQRQAMTPFLVGASGAGQVVFPMPVSEAWHRVAAGDAVNTIPLGTAFGPHGTTPLPLAAGLPAPPRRGRRRYRKPARPREDPAPS